VLLAGFAIFELTNSSFARRTFEFFTFERGTTVVEDRIIPKSSSKELDIERYVGTALLGPVSLDLAPLFTPGTKLRSLLYRDGVLYADLSEIAALPIRGNRDVVQCLETLERGIRRNFPYISEVALFIDGNQINFENFR
jgi:hypothetical protein